MAMGAFIAGLLIADSPFRHEVIGEIEPFRGLLLGLFFMSMGMSLEVDVFLEQPVVTIGLLFTLILIKFAILWPLSMLFGLRVKTGAGVALLLAQSGEFGLILFAYAYQTGLLGADLFQQLLVVVVLSMLLTPALALVAERLASQSAGHSAKSDEVPARAPVVLAGFGRVGRRIGQILSLAGTPYVAIDQNSSLVLRERANGHSVYYGDARRPGVLRAAGAGDASLVIVTLDDFEATERVVAALHETHPDITILARGHNSEQCRRLLQLGAKLALSENLEASLELARTALIHEHDDVERAEELLQRFRQDYYASVGDAKSPATSRFDTRPDTHSAERADPT
jgi:voltage-gated potassium channel Kch